MTTATRYVLFQVPGWLLAAAACGVAWRYELVSGEVAAGLLALWVAKDAAFYPLLRIGYEHAPTGTERLVGERGVVREPLEPVGWIEIHGALWRAEVVSTSRPQRGERVVVREARGLTLLVVSEKEDVGAEERGRR